MLAHRSIISLVFCLAASWLPLRAQEFQLHPDLELKLFAREPLVVDPVALTFDAAGRMYVVEMRDYPYGIGPERKPGGTVRLLVDENGDGTADSSTVFAEGLSFPTSIAAWNDGVLVTAPPEIIFLKDTNGDGVAEVREVMFRGFSLGVTDSNANGLRWALDNRFHGANGGSGGTISSTKNPDRKISIRNLDFSFNPLTSDFTPTYQTSGGFGLVFDDAGRSFSTYNIDHIQHRAIPARYLQRFPGMPAVEITRSISDHGEMARIYPISEPETRVNHPEQAGHFSSAGGMGYIGHAGYGADLYGSVVVGDVVGNLLHRDVIVPDGAGFIARRPASEKTHEFLASRDPAFRPVGLELGPDDALYLIDMQRDVIEHPDYIPQKVKEKADLRGGEDRGRIYRLTLKKGLVKSVLKLARATSLELVNELASQNQTRRLTAQRLLWERQDKSVVPALQQSVRTHASSLARLHALWTLQGLQSLDEATLLHALRESDPLVNEHAAVLAEAFTNSTAIAQTLLTLATHAHARTRFQAALSLGEFHHLNILPAITQILRQDYAQKWTRLAALSSLRSGSGDLLLSLLSDPQFVQTSAPEKFAVTSELAALTAARATPEDSHAVGKIISLLVTNNLSSDWRVACLEGFQEGLARRPQPFVPGSEIAQALEQFQTGAPTKLLTAILKTRRALNLSTTESERVAILSAARMALDSATAEPARIEAIQLLALGQFDEIKPTLYTLLDANQPRALQEAALRALALFNQTEVADTLIKQWRQVSPPLRPLIVQVLLQKRGYHEALVSALETETIRSGELNLDLEQRRRLLRGSSDEIKTRAAKFFSDEEYSNRKTIVTEWLEKLPAQGNAFGGKEIFHRLCASCHRIGDIGHQVGPDLTDIGHRSVEDLLSNILDPNMAINPNYASTTVEWDTDELTTGLLEFETPETLTLLQPLGMRVTILRSKIKRIESAGLSLMPEGLEAGLAPQDLRDLIAFLQTRR